MRTSPATSWSWRASSGVVEGDRIGRFLDWLKQKYGTDYSLDSMDFESNFCFRLRLTWVFALAEKDFSGSPRRWIFDR